MFSQHEDYKPVTRFLIGYGSYGNYKKLCSDFTAKLKELGVTDKNLMAGDFISTEGTLLTATCFEKRGSSDKLNFYRLYYNGQQICETRHKDSFSESYIYMFPNLLPLDFVKTLKATEETAVNTPRPIG